MFKLAVVFVFFCVMIGCSTAPDEFQPEPQEPGDFLGRWDVTVSTPSGEYPSWFEIFREDHGPAGRFVGRIGSVRPIQQLQISGDLISFSLPVQYERHSTDLSFTGRLKEGRLEGTTNAPDGSTLQWTAEKAPALISTGHPDWGDPIQLFNGSDLTGWRLRNADLPLTWEVAEGALLNTEKGSDLVSEGVFGDFRLQIEFRYPAGSNSGVFLRGRYEVQVQDDFGKEPSSVFIGGVYGFLTPSINAGKPAEEWQSYDITLVGRRVTIVLNGETIIRDQEIPGITGGALDSREGTPGPIMLQGDHGPVSFRNIVLTPALGLRQ